MISGDLWAGAEVQTYTLISHLVGMPDVRVAAALMNEGELADRLRGIPVEVFLMDERRLGALRILAHLRAVMEAWRPDVVHTHREKENILGSLANRLTGNVPSVRTVHGWVEHQSRGGLARMRRAVLSALDRWCARTLQQRVIAVSKELAIKVARELPAERIAVVENGVDRTALLAELRTAQFRMSKPAATHVGIVGRLVEVKRVDLFLHAAALLCAQQGRDWRFHVFGDGPLRARLEELSDRIGLAEAVTFHGHRSDVATCIAGLDAVVICSDHEGMPMVALEAAALGVPTVAHAVGGLTEVIPQEFLVTRHDASGYADGLRRALQDNGREIAARGTLQVLTQYSAASNADRIRGLYEQVIAERFARESEGGTRRRHRANT